MKRSRQMRILVFVAPAHGLCAASDIWHGGTDLLLYEFVNPLLLLRREAINIRQRINEVLPLAPPCTLARRRAVQRQGLRHDRWCVSLSLQLMRKLRRHGGGRKTFAVSQQRVSAAAAAPLSAKSHSVVLIKAPSHVLNWNTC